MYIYKPNSIQLLNHLSFFRQIPGSQALTEEEKSKLDTRTIFFDVFLDRHTKQLKAIGPRLFNLKSILFPLTLIVEKKIVKHRVFEVERLVFLESDPLPDLLPTSINVTLIFKEFEQRIIIHWHKVERYVREFDDSKLTITTLQKDNHFTWISDWIRWHKRLYGVQRLVLYDNGSSNREKLIDDLQGLESEIDIIFVDWIFPYGVTPFEYTQHGSLNHVRLKFPVVNSFCINLDIDEYLVKHGSESLVRYLNRNLSDPSPGAITIQEYLVPNIRTKGQNGTVRIFDFRYRFREIGYTKDGSRWEEFGRMKYIFRFNSVGYTATHRTISEKNKIFSKRYKLQNKIKFYLRKVVRELFRNLYRYNHPKPRIDAIHAPVSEMFFLHFLGLSTVWQTSRNKNDIKFDNTFHVVEEPLISELSRYARLN